MIVVEQHHHIGQYMIQFFIGHLIVDAWFKPVVNAFPIDVLDFKHSIVLVKRFPEQFEVVSRRIDYFGI